MTRLVPEPGFGTLLIRSGAEAGMVGGLADWFAVTALFRRPLGLPIPHTAIIPNNKDRIGRTIGRFIERNFLTTDVLLPKLREMHVGARFAAWLAAPSTAPLVAHSITAMLPYLIHSLRSPDLGEFLQRILSDQFRQADFAPMIGRGLRVLTGSQEANILFERVSELASGWLEKNRDQIDKLVADRSRWWIPKAIDRRIAAAIVNGITELLNGLSRPESEVSSRFREALTSAIDEMINSAEQREKINEGMRRLLAHPETQDWVRSVWNEICQATLDDLARPSSRLRVALEKPVSIVAEALGADAAMQRHIDEVVEDLSDSVIAWRSEIGSFFAEVVRNWDTRTLSDRLELVVGSDLQYIRMNGTIVGACAGCLIFMVTWLLG
ncbi:DUF445 domain-containing protein [Bradyrhizobium sp. STM 3562]|uniref:DUF445 domain-containing protein n=1 Tax=Bradyrhizobium sp. STM 3562 TaxID=578924 RepID=UPI00388F80FA